MRINKGFTPLGRQCRHLTGFTLLESIIVISLLGLVGLSFAYLYTTAQRFTIQSVNATSTQTDAAFALEHIKRNLTPATAIVTPATVAPAVGSSGNTLEFTWQMSATTPVRTSRYEVNGTDLRFIPNTAAAGTFEVIARGIQTGGTLSPLFSRATAGTVSIDVTAQKTAGADTRKMRLQTNVSPRGLFQ